MTGKTRFRLGSALLVAFAVAACGDSDSTGPDEVQLDQQASLEIAAELLDVVMSVGFDAFGAPAWDDPAAVAAAIPGPSFNVETVEASAACEHGGSIAVVGTFTDDIDPDTGSGHSSFELTQTPIDCGVQTSHGLFTVNGNPHLSFGADMTVADWWPDTITVVFSGGYSWTGSPGAGSCSMNLTFNLDYADPEAATMSGTVCGHAV